MLIQTMKSKISYATISHKDLFYVGSITIDQSIMDAANIVENERVQIVNLNNGERLETYVITGKRNSGIFALNGPAARRCEVDDHIFIVSYGWINPAEEKLTPIVVDLREKSL